MRGRLVGVLGVLALTSCGGTDEGRRAESFEVVTVDDPGSVPVRCSVDDEYDFGTIDTNPVFEDFELGSVVGGWYLNNDQCDECDKLINQLRDLQVEVPNCGILDESVEEEALCAQKAQLEAEIEICKPHCLAAASPNPYQKPLPAARIQEPRCGSQYAMHIQGGPMTRWGGVMGVQFAAPGIDASDWDGVAFWARVGPESRHPIRFEVSDKFTDDKVREEAKPDEEQAEACLSDAPRDQTREGCDKFGVNRSLTTDWQFFAIPFEEMRQSGWGMQAPYLDKAGLRSLSFMYATGVWDIWIDDLALFRRKNP